MIKLNLPIKTVSESNARGHWSKRHKRAAAQRTCIGLALRPMTFGLTFPCTVLLARIAPRQLDDDNLRGALKACRDGAADALGVKDNDPRVVWAYDQRKGAPREYAVEIQVTHG